MGANNRRIGTSEQAHQSLHQEWTGFGLEAAGWLCTGAQDDCVQETGGEIAPGRAAVAAKITHICTTSWFTGPSRCSMRWRSLGICGVGCMQVLHLLAVQRR